MKYICILFIFVFANSCIVSQSKYPAWYTEVLNDTSNTMYGQGDGYDRNSAIKNALKNVTEKIVIRVYSETSSFANESNGDFSSETTVRGNYKSEEIEITSYNVEKIERIGESFFALVSVNKNELANNYDNKIYNLSAKVKEIYDLSKNNSDLYRLLTFDKIKLIINDINKYENIIQYLNFSSKHSDKISENKSIEKELTALKNKLTFYVKASSNLDRKIGSAIKNELANEGFIVNKVVNAKRDIIFDIYSSVNRSKVAGNFVSNINLNISIMEKGKIMGQKSIKHRGFSRVDYAYANNNAVSKIEKEIKKQGIFNILNIK